MQLIFLSSLLVLAAAGPVHQGVVALRAVKARSLVLIGDDEGRAGSSSCPCVGFDNVEKGERTVTWTGTTGSDVQVSYPASFGARCQAWDNGLSPGCKEGQKPGKGQDWCANSWCYVDPCKCDIPQLPVLSVNKEGSYKGRPLYYSYHTCGSADQFTEGLHKSACVNQKDAGACQALGKCAWDGKRCGGKEAMGMCMSKMHGFDAGMGGCRCVGIAGLGGSFPTTVSNSSVNYPAEVGTSCQTWDKEANPECTVEAGRGTPGEKPSWCAQKWCYVDPCSCNLETPPVTSAAFPGATFQGKPMYYSYATCGSTDMWSAANHKIACINQKNSGDCATNPKCAWTGKKCLGKDLVNTCTELPDKGEEATTPKKSAAAAAAPLALVAVLLGRAA